MDGAGDIDTGGAAALDDTEAQSTPRDYEGEAKGHGWTPKDEFKGDPAKWVDAETFVRRADEVMPFLKKQNAGLKRELDEIKRTVKQSAEFYSKAEERAYQRAMTDLQAKHDQAVELGDVAGARKVLNDMKALDVEVAKPVETPKGDDPAEANRKFAAWVEDNDWYVLDDKKRTYADLQASTLGPAAEYDGGHEAWLSEVKRRVERKFADPKPVVTNGGGNRGAPSGGGKTYNDLPAAAKAMADRFVKQGIIKDRDAYVKDYQWD